MIALMADWSRFHLSNSPENELIAEDISPQPIEQMEDDKIPGVEELEATKNV